MVLGFFANSLFPWTFPDDLLNISMFFLFRAVLLPGLHCELQPGCRCALQVHPGSMQDGPDQGGREDLQGEQLLQRRKGQH